MMHSKSSGLDPSAIGLSGLCLLHCLGLPFLAAFLPHAGLLAEAEWIHRALALVALPITALALLQHKEARVGLGFVLPAILGLSLLLAAAFAGSLEAWETGLTTLGATLLGAAHLWRWSRRTARA